MPLYDRASSHGLSFIMIVQGEEFIAATTNAANSFNCAMPAPHIDLSTFHLPGFGASDASGGPLMDAAAAGEDHTD